jgi:hypothetical protein
LRLENFGSAVFAGPEDCRAIITIVSVYFATETRN